MAYRTPRTQRRAFAEPRAYLRYSSYASAYIAYLCYNIVLSITLFVKTYLRVQLSFYDYVLVFTPYTLHINAVRFTSTYGNQTK